MSLLHYSILYILVLYLHTVISHNNIFYRLLIHYQINFETRKVIFSDGPLDSSFLYCRRELELTLEFLSFSSLISFSSFKISFMDCLSGDFDLVLDAGRSRNSIELTGEDCNEKEGLLS